MATITDVQITDNGDGSSTVTIGLFGYMIQTADLFTHPDDPYLVLNNVRVFLCEAGFTSLTSEAQAALAAHTFHI